jgi:hypothetical protein
MKTKWEVYNLSYALMDDNASEIEYTLECNGEGKRWVLKYYGNPIAEKLSKYPPFEWANRERGKFYKESIILEGERNA